MTWSTYHSQSEALAAEAHEAARVNDTKRAASLYREAAVQEVLALSALDMNKSRTLGVTVVSAASLFYKSGDLRQAEKVSHQWIIKPELPDFAAAELRALLQTIWTDIRLAESGLKFGREEVLVSVKGGEIIVGGAPMDLILSKVEQVKSLFFRTAEWMLKKPHRKRGGPEEEVLNVCRPWLFQAAPGSYQFAIRVQQTPQMSLFGDTLEGDKIADKFLDIVKAGLEDPDGSLKELVPDNEYRSTFLRLTRGLAPNSDSFSQMEIRTADRLSGKRPIVLVQESRKVLSLSLKALKPQTKDAEQSGEPRRIKGILRALDLERDWLEVIETTAEGPRPVRIVGASDSVDDVIGPMVNRKVIVDALVGADGKLTLQDIQSES